MSLNITLADYGVGNLYSIKRSLERCGANVEVVTDMSRLLDAECIVLPGVGAFDRTVRDILPYREQLREKLESGTPALGICIGMQNLHESSEEGSSPGIGLLKGQVVRLQGRTIPHMGWNYVRTEDPVFDGISDRHFYFAHSYRGSDLSSSVATTDYEGTDIPVMFRRSNTYATQFHPEKSSTSGLAFLKNFIDFAEGCL